MISKNTTNISFKNFQYKLQDNEKQNCFFINETLDKHLVDIDVYQKLDELKNKQTERGLFIDRVRRECENNIWYYFREVVRIPDTYHIASADNTGLAKYPLTDLTAKLIYLYDNGFSTMIVHSQSKNDISLSHVTFITLAYIALWEEYFSQKNDHNTSYVNFFENIDNEEIFKNDMLQGLWSINSIVGSIDGLTPYKESMKPWNFKIFKKPKTLDYSMRNSFIAPLINSDKDIECFLKESQKRGNKNCIGRIFKNDDIKSFYLLDNYALDNYFALKDDLTIYDEDLSSYFDKGNCKIFRI